LVKLLSGDGGGEEYMYFKGFDPFEEGGVDAWYRDRAGSSSNSNNSDDGAAITL